MHWHGSQDLGHDPIPARVPEQLALQPHERLKHLHPCRADEAAPAPFTGRAAVQRSCRTPAGPGTPRRADLRWRLDFSPLSVILLLQVGLIVPENLHQ